MPEMTNAQVPPTYKMTIDLNVIDHLGLNLYSNISAVLTEAVANAWDADAHNVDIHIDIDAGHDTIVINDDGMGMSVSDMNEKYLRVGYRRRSHGLDKTPLGRPVMGRKGLGKLSLFSIADIVEVQSIKDGQRHGLTMDKNSMREVCNDHPNEYYPEPIANERLTVERGTIITLHKINRQRLSSSINALRMKLSRRFSVIGESFGFKVSINGSPVTVEDRGELKVAQFLWKIGDTVVTLPSGNHIEQTFSIANESGDFSGWIATARKPKNLESDGDNLNQIVILSRGRLIQENILDKLNDGRIFTKYLTGQVQCDLLDETSAGEDIATTDRQRLVEDDPRYIKVLEFLKRTLSQIDREWNATRPSHEAKNIIQEYPIVKDWLDGLRPGTKKTEEKMIGQVASLSLDNAADVKTFLKHSILAFERMELRGSEAEFTTSISDVNKLLELLADRDSLEAALYRDIVKSRIEAIRGLCGHVDKNDLEKVMQKFLFEHLWLLDTSWERADGSERIEQSLKKEYKEFADNLTEEESNYRIDIRYRTSAGSHIIVELKRAERTLKIGDLVSQGQGYYSALKKCLNKMGIENPNIQVYFVLGKPVKEQDDASLPDDFIKNALNSIHGHIRFYEQMIDNARKSYADYLEKDEALGRLDRILASL